MQFSKCKIHWTSKTIWQQNKNPCFIKAWFHYIDLCNSFACLFSIRTLNLRAKVCRGFYPYVDDINQMLVTKIAKYFTNFLNWTDFVTVFCNEHRPIWFINLYQNVFLNSWKYFLRNGNYSLVSNSSLSNHTNSGNSKLHYFPYRCKHFSLVGTNFESDNVFIHVGEISSTACMDTSLY